MITASDAARMAQGLATAQIETARAQAQHGPRWQVFRWSGDGRSTRRTLAPSHEITAYLVPITERALVAAPDATRTTIRRWELTAPHEGGQPQDIQAEDILRSIAEPERAIAIIDTDRTEPGVIIAEATPTSPPA